ncbi:single-strand-selective monofunctional uracil-DNA glycosylase 1, partial [Rhincodon typus]|uniref:single-strand-selective monofunctional uracil-DNA glycosylase 1 n=1 Tax=Rhincodon typus TaxID=259920 RepID=UPI00202F2E54
VPFGEVESVRDWLGLGSALGSVSRPAREHPRRPVLGLRCLRSEVSGARFWGLFRHLCGPSGPRSLFRSCFVHNLCPLAFLDERGRNVTPAELPPGPRGELLQACGAALDRVVRLLGVSTVVGVGRLAEQTARRALSGSEPMVRVVGLPHPSPRNPKANRGWQRDATDRLEQLGITRLLTPDPQLAPDQQLTPGPDPQLTPAPLPAPLTSDPQIVRPFWPSSSLRAIPLFVRQHRSRPRPPSHWWLGPRLPTPIGPSGRPSERSRRAPFYPIGRWRRPRPIGGHGRPSRFSSPIGGQHGRGRQPTVALSAFYWRRRPSINGWAAACPRVPMVRMGAGGGGNRK